MKLKITKFIIGAVLAQGIALGVVTGLIWLIPVRGTELAIIVLPIAFFVMIGITYASAVLAFGDVRTWKW